MPRVKYENEYIEFKLLYKKRKTIKISINRNLDVEVTSPIGIKEEVIKNIVLKRGRWILNKKSHLKELPPIIEKHYVSGEIHKYLGKEYELKVMNNFKNEVKIENNSIFIYSINPKDNEYNKKLLYKWYKESSYTTFNNIFEKCYDKLKKYNIKKPTWNFRKMKLKWGSYNTRTNNILINTELVQSSIYCIEFVIMHELCHCKHPNHSKDFYKFMDLVMEDWEKRKKRLDNVSIC